MATLASFFFAQSISRRKRRLGSLKIEGILGPVGLMKVPKSCQSRADGVEFSLQGIRRLIPSKSPISAWD